MPSGPRSRHRLLERARDLRTRVILAATVIAAVILAVVTFRTTFQLEALRARALFEATYGLAEEKVDRVDGAIVQADDGVMSLGDNGHPDDIARRWRPIASRTRSIARVVVLDSSPAHEIVAYASRTPGPADDVFRALLLQKIVPDLDLASLPLDQLKHVHKAFDGTLMLLSYWRASAELADGSMGERLVVVQHDLDAIARELLPLVVPEVRGSSSRVNVIDDDNRIVFGAPLIKSDFVVTRRFPTTLYAWRLQLAPAANDEIAQEIRNRRRTEMALLALSCIVVLAGVVALLLANAQERQLNALRGEFVANVSHELKTPLALVRMFGELLMTGRVASDEKRKQYLSIIVRESERLTALIENVLDFARVERGKGTYDFVDADLGQAVQRAVDACRYRAETEGMSIDLSISDGTGSEGTGAEGTGSEGMPSAHIDERAMQLVVINLVENAIKYAPGTGVVKVDVRAEGACHRIVVTDRGPGIAIEDRGRIFERFYRGKGAGERQVRGSGIGLALVKHIVEAHGGEVRVESGDDGVGSRFVVTLPFSTRAA